MQWDDTRRRSCPRCSPPWRAEPSTARGRRRPRAHGARERLDPREPRGQYERAAGAERGRPLRRVRVDAVTSCRTTSRSATRTWAPCPASTCSSATGAAPDRARQRHRGQAEAACPPGFTSSAAAQTRIFPRAGATSPSSHRDRSRRRRRQRERDIFVHDRDADGDGITTSRARLRTRSSALRARAPRATRRARRRRSPRTAAMWRSCRSHASCPL